MRKLFIALLLCVVAVVSAQKKYYSLKDAQYLLTNENGEVCLIFPDNNRNTFHLIFGAITRAESLASMLVLQR